MFDHGVMHTVSKLGRLRMAVFVNTWSSGMDLENLVVYGLPLGRPRMASSRRPRMALGRMPTALVVYTDGRLRSPSRFFVVASEVRLGLVRVLAGF